MTDENIREAAVIAATGHNWKYWFKALDEHEAGSKPRPQVTKWLHSELGLDPWWAQTVMVQYERERGIRVVGQSCDGDFQVSCSKTVPLKPTEAWHACMDNLEVIFGTELDLTIDAITINNHVAYQTRVVKPGNVLRVWQHGEHRTTVQLMMIENGTKTSIRIMEEGMESLDEREAARAKWKEALQALVDRIH